MALRRVSTAVAVAVVALAGTLAGSTPAPASSCVVVNPYSAGAPSAGVVDVVRIPPTEGACALAVVTTIAGDPNHYWVSWYIQETIDPFYPDLNQGTRFQYRRKFANWQNGGIDLNSSDFNVMSGYAYLSRSAFGDPYTEFEVRMKHPDGKTTNLIKYFVQG